MGDCLVERPPLKLKLSATSRRQARITFPINQVMPSVSVIKKPWSIFKGDTVSRPLMGCGMEFPLGILFFGSYDKTQDHGRWNQLKSARLYINLSTIATVAARLVELGMARATVPIQC